MDDDLGKDQDQGRTDWGFTDAVCLRFYDNRVRKNNPGAKIAAAKAALRTFFFGGRRSHFDLLINSHELVEKSNGAA